MYQFLYKDFQYKYNKFQADFFYSVSNLHYNKP